MRRIVIKTLKSALVLLLRYWSYLSLDLTSGIDAMQLECVLIRWCLPAWGGNQSFELKTTSVRAFWSSLRWFQSVVVWTILCVCCSVFEWGTKKGNPVHTSKVVWIIVLNKCTFSGYLPFLGKWPKRSTEINYQTCLTKK